MSRTKCTQQSVMAHIDTTMTKRMKDNEQNQMPIRAVLITMPSDDTVRIADFARVLYRCTDFQLTVIECDVRPLPYQLFHTPLTGLTTTGFATKAFIKYGRSESQVHCRMIWEWLEDLLSKDGRLDINYISGRRRVVMNALRSRFGLFVCPRSFQPMSAGKQLFPDFYTELVRSARTPVLFCPTPVKWQRIMIIDADKDQDYSNASIMDYLAKFLGDAVLRKKPDETPTLCLHSESSSLQSPSLTSYGILDASQLSREQQVETTLVVSTRIACSILRYRRLRVILQNWSGSTLVFPPLWQMRRPKYL